MLSQIDLHFLQMAKLAGEKSQLTHSKRGAIVTKGNTIISQGINAHLDQAANAKYFGATDSPSPAGLQDEKYIATINAETVAIAVAIGINPNLSELTIYISEEPIWATYKWLITLGIKRIVYYGPAKNKRIKDYSQALGVEIVVVA